MVEWRIVPEWTNYEIAQDGTVRRRMPGKGTHVGRILKPWPGRHGYPQVGISRMVGGVHLTRSRSVHRLVMAAWVGSCPEGMECHHIDGDKTNPHLSNLEYVTHKDNIRHAVADGLWGRARGEASGSTKLNAWQVRLARSLYDCGEMRIAQLAKLFGITRAPMGYIVHRQTWTHI